MRPTARQLHAVASHLSRQKCVSFIGLGRMGFEMAFNLFSKTLAERPDSRFLVCDAMPEVAQGFRQNFLSQFPSAHVDITATPEEAVRSSQTVITMLPSSPQVQTVYLGSAGIIAALRSLPENDTLCIDSTTLDVEVARQVARDVISAGAQMVDAPVSGGVAGAKAGTLSFLVGGSSGAYDRSRPFLTQMGKRVIYCGPSGSGLMAKICNNLVLGVQQIVVAEAMLLGLKSGLDPAVLAGVINSSTGGCWASSTNNPVPSALPDMNPPCERGYEGGFATALMLKDMGLATHVAETSSIPLPLGHAARNIYAQVLKQQPELGKKDFSSVYLWLKEASNRVDVGGMKES